MDFLSEATLVFFFALPTDQLAVVSKKSDVVAGGLDAQHPPALVLHFLWIGRLAARHMFDARAFHQRLEIALRIRFGRETIAPQQCHVAPSASTPPAG